MLGYIEYLNIPLQVALGIAIVFFAMQCIGEIIEFKGKAVPEILKVRKYFSRKKTEREILQTLPETLLEVKQALDLMNEHCNADSQQARDEWMSVVNDRLEKHDGAVAELSKKLDANNRDTLLLLIDSKRNAIISFASHVVDENSLVTREQFNRIFKLYEEYESIIDQNGLTNGEINVAIRIVTEAYEAHLRNHTFLEDIRGYTV